MELSTGCKASVHGQWIKIKGQSSSARRQAFSLINSFADNSCKEVGPCSLVFSPFSVRPTLIDLCALFSSQIFLPSLDEVASDPARLATPSPPSSPEPTKSAALPPQRKAGLTRSSTETLISSLQQQTSKSPFSSVLVPLHTSQPKDTAIPEETASEGTDQSIAAAPELPTDANNNNMNSDSCDGDESQRKRHKYSLDFLLLRSDVPNAKKLPSSWKALNEKFPAICFCGKVSEVK